MATSHKRKRIIAGALMSASAAMASLELQVPPTPELLQRPIHLVSRPMRSSARGGKLT